MTALEDPPVRPCVLDDPHPAHERANGKWCPGLEEDEEADERALARELVAVPLGLDPDELPPNVLRRYRVLLGVTHAEIDENEARLWRETGRVGPVAW